MTTAPAPNKMLDRHGHTITIGDRVRVLTGDDCIPSGTILTLRAIKTTDDRTRARADDAESPADDFTMAGWFSPIDIEKFTL